MAVLESQQCAVFWATATGAGSTGSSAEIGNVVDFSGPSGAAAVIDITSLSDSAKVKMMGIPDEGQLSLSVFYDPGNAAQADLQADRAARTQKKCVIKFTDAATNYAVFNAYCLQFAVSGAVDDAVKANVVLEIANEVTWTTSTADFG